MDILGPKWGPHAMGTPIGCGLYREQSENGPILTQNGTFWTQNGDPHHGDTPRVSYGGGNAKNTPKIALFGPKMGAHIIRTLPGSQMGGEMQKTPPKLHFLDPKWGPTSWGHSQGLIWGGKCKKHSQNWTFWTQNGDPKPWEHP